MAAAAPAAATTTAAFTAASAATTAATTAAAAATGTTSASALEVGVANHEPAAHEAVNVVDLGPLYQRGAFRIDQDSDSVGLDDKVILFGFRLHAKHVLEAAVGSRRHHDA